MIIKHFILSLRRSRRSTVIFNGLILDDLFSYFKNINDFIIYTFLQDKMDKSYHDEGNNFYFYLQMNSFILYSMFIEL